MMVKVIGVKLLRTQTKLKKNNIFVKSILFLASIMTNEA